MGLTYNPRGSTAYLYAVEVLPPRMRLIFGSTLFFVDGLVSVSAAYYFYKWKSVNVVLIVIGAFLTSAIITMNFLLPETPQFLLVRGKVDAYQLSIARLTNQSKEKNQLNALDISNLTDWRK